MKKTTTIFTIALFLCIAMFLFTTISYNSMKFNVIHHLGDEKLLDDISVESVIGDSKQRFEILIKNGSLTYEYHSRYDQTSNDLYLSDASTQDIDATGLTFKEVEEDMQNMDEQETQTRRVFESELERFDYKVSLTSRGWYSDINEILLSTESNVSSGLQLVSTPEHNITYEIVSYTDEVDTSASGTVRWDYPVDDALCFKIADQKYVGMVNINEHMEGSAHLYDITLKDAKNQSLLVPEYKILLEIPIELGTNGFLYVYQGQYVVVLQKNDLAQIYKYDANMTLLEQVEIPLVNRNNRLLYYGDKNMFVLKTDTTLTAFDIGVMEFVDQVTLEDGYVIEDSIYRNGRFYVTAMKVDEKNTSMNMNMSILVYEEGKNVYAGEIYLFEKATFDPYMFPRFYREYTTFVRDAL